MKTETKEIYKCDFCNKLYQMKRYATRHEKLCFKNPENYRPCFDCSHLTKKEITITVSGTDWDNEQTLDLFYCEVKKHFLYTPQNEIKENQIDLEGEDEENKPMPIQCSEQSSNRLF